MEYIEVSAKTVNDAIMKACMELEVPSDELEIEVISEGSKGFLGIGGKPAVIKVAKKEQEKPVVKEKKPEKKEKKAPFKEEKKAPVREEKKAAVPEVKAEEAAEPKTEEEKPEGGKAPEENAAHGRSRKRNNKKNFDRECPEVKEKPEVIKEKTEEEIAAMKADAQKFLEDVFAAMNLSVTMEMAYEKEGGSLAIDIAGDDMGVLIGKRGQTLDSLQYLVSLVVNKGQKDYIRIKLDTEDYRRRRRETLENLAKNIANKVRKTRRPVVLEAMNPYERRIIHSALQSNKYVETYSEGHEPYRHVVVSLKKDRRYDSEK